MILAREVILTSWFVIVAVAFFAPYLTAGSPDLSVFYAVFLLSSVAVFVLRMLPAHRNAESTGEGRLG